jgi:hypothetical protein
VERWWGLGNAQTNGGAQKRWGGVRCVEWNKAVRILPEKHLIQAAEYRWRLRSSLAVEEG